MLEDLQPLLGRRRVQKLADVLPCFQEGPGVVADPLDGRLPLGDVREGPLEFALFRLQPLQFRLDAGQPPRPERLEHFDQAANVGTHLGHAAAGQFFFVAEAVGFAAEAGQRLLHDAISRLDHSADVPDAAHERVFECFGGDAGGLAGVFSALVLLPGADVVVVHGGPAVGRRTDHVRSARAPQEARERVDATLRLLEVHPPRERLAELELHPVELLLRDERVMAAFLDRLAPANLAQVDGVAEDADHLLFDEPVAAPLLIRAGPVGRVADAQVVQPPRDRSGRAEFLERIEDAPDDLGPHRLDLQLAGVVRHRAVAQDVAAIPQTAVGPVPHDREGPLGRHLPFELGEDHDELDHRLAGRHRGVELLPQGNDVDIVFGEERPQIHEVFQASRDPVELEADDQVDPAGRDVPLESLKLRTVLVLGALAGIDVELQGLDCQVLPPLAELDLLLDLVLLGDEAVPLGGLPL